MNEQIKKALTAIPVLPYEVVETSIYKGQIAKVGFVFLVITVQTKELFKKLQKRKRPIMKRETFKGSIYVERSKIDTEEKRAKANEHLFKQLSEKYNLVKV